MKLERVCIFCASSPGIGQVYFEAAEALASELVENNIAVNFGGGATGLMGSIADMILAAGGKVTGYIPQFMVEMEWAHTGVNELIIVKDMVERKRLMRNDADAIIALPGGIGTLEELTEVITLKQLGQFPKPIIILNTNGFYDPLLMLLQNMMQQQFMRRVHETLWQVVGSPSGVIGAIRKAPVWDSSALKIAAVNKR